MSRNYWHGATYGQSALELDEAEREDLAQERREVREAQRAAGPDPDDAYEASRLKCRWCGIDIVDQCRTTAQAVVCSLNIQDDLS